jgi:trk system potassium uptake protein TrkH
MQRRVSDVVVRKALAVLVLSLALAFVVTLLLLIVEPLPLMPLLFEAISAIGTVGLSLGVTPHLTDAGKLIVSAAMLIGRVGVVMVMIAVFSSRSTSAVRYSEEPMLVG